jgi:hypothetical protein
MEPGVYYYTVRKKKYGVSHFGHRVRIMKTLAFGHMVLRCLQCECEFTGGNTTLTRNELPQQYWEKS